jgi:hypothetical protein
MEYFHPKCAKKIATLLSNLNRLVAGSDCHCALFFHKAENLKTFGKYATSMLTLVTSEANSNVNLDHISFNLLNYFYNKN